MRKIQEARTLDGETWIKVKGAWWLIESPETTFLPQIREPLEGAIERNVTEYKDVNLDEILREGKHHNRNALSRKLKTCLIVACVFCSIFIVTYFVLENRVSSPITLVRDSITTISPSGHSILTGYLSGGTAVLVDDMAAYWVRNGVVYAANGWAKTWSPQISYIRDGSISFVSVRDAVQ